MILHQFLHAEPIGISCLLGGGGNKAGATVDRWPTSSARGTATGFLGDTQQLTEAEFVEEARRSSMEERAQATLAADKVLTF